MSQRNNAVLSMVEEVLGHMDDSHGKNVHGGILLSGDPGIGKTTFVQMVGSLLGMHTITIEVPHVTEEHLINIPFIVFNPTTGATQQKTTQIENQSYQMILADSNLFTELQNSHALSDDAYLKSINEAPAAVQNVFKALGGTADKIPPAIQEARRKYKTILFLDEFFRTTTIRIRNVMRGMLNGNIGKHKIPNNVYTIYASNMRDNAGIDETPNNFQFQEVEYPSPKAEDWFDWLVQKYEDDQHIRLNHQVIDKFKALLNDQDMSNTDASSEVRTSPRRWEQLLTYINASIPARDVAKARALITNVKNNFVHYKTKQYSPLAQKVVKAVIELIRETSGINLQDGDTLEDDDWRDALDHLVEAQMKTGNKRKHIPVVSGPPGIGKTYNAADVAAKHNLRLIDIDVGEMYSDDAIGLPIPGQRHGDQITVQFSWPKLYDRIMSTIQQKDKQYLESLASLPPDEARQKADAYKHQKFKYLIFFDELNRVDPKTFNSMRRVILEKNFGEKDGEPLKLPSEAVVVAAINPDGVGVEDMTDHFRDVVDVINAQGSWPKLKQFLMAKKLSSPDVIKDIAWHIIDTFAKKFATRSTKSTANQAPFTLDIGGAEVYMSPREYTDMFVTMARKVNTAVQKALDDPDIKESQMREFADTAVSSAMIQNMTFPMRKAGVEPDEFFEQLHSWIQSLPSSVYGGLLTKKVKNPDALGGVLEKYLDGHDLSQMPEDGGIVNANSSANDVQVMDEIRNVLFTRIHDDDTVNKYFLDKTHPTVTLKGDDIVFDQSKHTSLVENFFRAMVYTLHIHQYSNSRLEVVCRSLSDTMSKLNKTLVKEKKVSTAVGREASLEALEIRPTLDDIIQGL